MIMLEITFRNPQDITQTHVCVFDVVNQKTKTFGVEEPWSVYKDLVGDGAKGKTMKIVWPNGNENPTWPVEGYKFTK